MDEYTLNEDQMAEQYKNLFALFDWVNFSRFKTKYLVDISGEDFSSDLLENFFSNGNELFALKNYDAIPLPSLKLAITEAETESKPPIDDILNFNLMDGIEELKKMIGMRLEQLKASNKIAH
jgi:hypothetical protein